MNFESTTFSYYCLVNSTFTRDRDGGHKTNWNHKVPWRSPEIKEVDYLTTVNVIKNTQDCGGISETKSIIHYFKTKSTK